MALCDLLVYKMWSVRHSRRSAERVFLSAEKTPTGILNTNGIMFIACILPSFMAQVHVEEVKFEREVYTREFHESYYRPGNYVASKIIAEMPMTILASLSFSAVLYWCVGLNPTAIAFFFLFSPVS